MATAFPDLPGPFAAHMAAIARQEKPFPTATGERHHFIPEFALRRFEGKTPSGRRLFVLDKTDGAISETTPKEAGWEHRLYSVQSIDGQHDGLIEAIFGLAETYAATSLRRLIAPAGGDPLTDEDRGNLSYFIATQEQRVPGALEDLRRNLVIGGTTHAAVQLANTKGSASKRRMGQDAYQSLISGDLALSPSHEAVLEMVLLSVAHTATLIYQLPWTLLRARQGASTFVTSDRPLTMYDPTPPHKFSAPGWMSSENVAAALPISKTACLRISPRDRQSFSTRDTTKQVERINRFTYGFATRFVYGSSRDELGTLQCWAESAPNVVPAPIPKRMVLLEDVRTADPAVADANEARGWDRYLAVRDDDGSERIASYEVLDTLEDAMKAIAPRPIADAPRVHGQQRHERRTPSS